MPSIHPLQIEASPGCDRFGSVGTERWGPCAGRLGHISRDRPGSDSPVPHPATRTDSFGVGARSWMAARRACAATRCANAS